MRFQFSHVQKVFFRKENITKGEILNYYLEISKWMLPQLKDRPLTLLRAPNGLGGEVFFQQNTGQYFPSWIKTKEIKKGRGTTRHVICNDEETLLYLANQGVITFHTWLSTIEHLDRPDKMVFDLDPPEHGGFEKVRETALKFKEYFDEKKITSFVMTTGSKGLHIVIPLLPLNKREKIRTVSRQIANEFAQRNPQELTVEMRKEKRKGRIFVDWMRNSWAQTVVCPYSVRLNERAAVAFPLSWQELAESDLGPQTFTIRNAVKKRKEGKDPWASFFNKANKE